VGRIHAAAKGSPVAVESARAGMGRDNIRVNVVCPSPEATGQTVDSSSRRRYPRHATSSDEAVGDVREERGGAGRISDQQRRTSSPGRTSRRRWDRLLPMTESMARDRTAGRSWPTLLERRRLLSTRLRTR